MMEFVDFLSSSVELNEELGAIFLTVHLLSIHSRPLDCGVAFSIGNLYLNKDFPGF